MDVDIRVANTTKLLNYAIGRGLGIDPQLVLDTLEGRLTEADLGLPVLESTEAPPVEIVVRPELLDYETKGALD